MALIIAATAGAGTWSSSWCVPREHQVMPAHERRCGEGRGTSAANEGELRGPPPSEALELEQALLHSPRCHCRCASDQRVVRAHERRCGEARRTSAANEEALRGLPPCTPARPSTSSKVAYISDARVISMSCVGMNDGLAYGVEELLQRMKTGFAVFLRASAVPPSISSGLFFILRRRLYRGTLCGESRHLQMFDRTARRAWA